MPRPQLSTHFQNRKPSAIRRAQILFAKRPDRAAVDAVNVAIGNVSLPMHPAMRARLAAAGQPGQAFADGVVAYTPSIGNEETRAAFLNIIASAGASTEGLEVVVTDGGSQAMELMVLGTCGSGAAEPLMLLDPAYTNYIDMARHAAVRTVSVPRELRADGRFAPPRLEAIAAALAEYRPRAMVVIPADNPTGSLITQEELVGIARLAVAQGVWLVSDEAYRQLHYSGGKPSSVWRITESEVPGIRGTRLSIETASKVWNACGLRIGALVTDNSEFHAKALAEYTANLCANTLGQWIFGALAHVPAAELETWYAAQRAYYADLMQATAAALVARMPGLRVSRPEAALYSVLDVAALVPATFDAAEFVAWCAETGRVDRDGKAHTLLVAPMRGFYDPKSPAGTGRTQMRIAYVETPARMKLVPDLLAALLGRYCETLES